MNIFLFIGIVIVALVNLVLVCIALYDVVINNNNFSMTWLDYTAMLFLILGVVGMWSMLLMLSPVELSLI
tara:strand:- start:83 stop:292 length:210 start_codon:yes stop_codon:yes gene_type:complete